MGGKREANRERQNREANHASLTNTAGQRLCHQSIPYLGNFQSVQGIEDRRRAGRYPSRALYPIVAHGVDVKDFSQCVRRREAKF